MSVLSQFAAGGIKSVQRGVAAAPNTSQSVTIPVPVNTAKAFLFVSVKHGIDRYIDNNGTNHYNSTTASARILNSTTIIVETLGGYTFNLVPPAVSWEVVEFY